MTQLLLRLEAPGRLGSCAPFAERSAVGGPGVVCLVAPGSACTQHLLTVMTQTAGLDFAKHMMLADENSHSEAKHMIHMLAVAATACYRFKALPNMPHKLYIHRSGSAHR